MMRSLNQGSSAPGGAGKGEEPEKLPELAEDESQVLRGTGHCKWFNVRMGFGFISMISREGNPLDIPVDVFVHQSKLFMEGFRSLKEGEPVEFTFKKSPKGLESIRVTGPGGNPCLGSERRPKGKTLQKRKPKADRWRRQDLLMDQMWTVREEESRMIPRCYNCGGLDHHAKECGLPPQPKKCHYCQSIMHMVANCPHKLVAQLPASAQGRPEAESQPCTSPSPREVGGGHGCTVPFPQEVTSEMAEQSDRSPQEVSATKAFAAIGEQNKKGPLIQKRKKT
ncbi:protein lin-28 homolog B isoform X1 [Rattus norvegicus]|uniref:Lin-28 homolog B n=1 Tax=Rattus norvegicus TaxID=10116 RepID=A0ABK0LGG3_RAT|nr:protein lin-28 homolog B isoform X1 [Rattus norvegicus]|eukprot:XP_006256662.1 PREDICTED: protein lin-28 homolog B isoform X1 [Rattus norvegicus]